MALSSRRGWGVIREGNEAMKKRALGTMILLVGWPLTGATPDLGQLADAMGARAGDAVVAARVGAALMLEDWMVPAAAPTNAAWLPGAVRGVPAMVLAPAPDGRREARFEGRAVRLVSLPEGAPMAEATLGGLPTAAAWHPSGAVLAVATPEGVEIRDGRTLGATGIRLVGATGPGMAFSADGMWLATGMREGGVGLWDWAEGRLAARGCPGVGRVEAVAFDGTGRWLRVGTMAGERVLDARGRGARDAWSGGLSPIAAAAFGPGGTTVVTVDSQGRVESMPWERPGKGTALLLASAPGAVSLDAKGEWVATVLGASKARLWNLGTGLPAGAWVTHPEVTRVAVGQGGGWLWTASGSSVRAVKPWVGQPVVVVSNEPVHAFVGNASGEWTVAIVGPTNAATGRVWKGDEPATEVARFPVVVPGPFDLDPTGTWVVTCRVQEGKAGRGLVQRLARTPDAPTDRPVIGPETPYDEARYAAGGRWLLARQAGVVTAWDAATGETRGKPIEGGVGTLAGVDVSPDGRWLRMEGAGGVVGLWSLESGESVAMVEPGARRGRQVNLPGARFSGDGGRVLVPDGRGGVRLVPLPPLAAAPGWLGEWARWVWGRTNAATGKEWDGLRRAVTEADARDPWTAWGRWWLADAGSRTMSPASGWTGAEWAREWAARKDPVAALEAWREGGGEGSTRAGLARQMQTNHAWGRRYRVEQGAWLAR